MSNTSVTPNFDLCSWLPIGPKRVSTAAWRWELSGASQNYLIWEGSGWTSDLRWKFCNVFRSSVLVNWEHIYPVVISEAKWLIGLLVQIRPTVWTMIFIYIHHLGNYCSTIWIYMQWHTQHMFILSQFIFYCFVPYNVDELRAWKRIFYFYPTFSTS
jgi:hypothetical protein